MPQLGGVFSCSSAWWVYTNYLGSKCHHSKIQAWQLFQAAGLEV